VPSLLELSAAIVAAHATPEICEALPEEVLVCVQKRMTKQRQIECLREYKRWDDTGRVLLKSCPYNAHGRKHGQLQARTLTGALRRTTMYRFGARAGGEHVEFFAQSGKPSLKTPYSCDGHVHGEMKWWYENGQLAGTQRFVNGLKDGPGLLFHANGTLWRSRSYLKGCKHGIFRTFDADGNLIKHQHYEAGVKRKKSTAAQLTNSCPGITFSLLSLEA